MANQSGFERVHEYLTGAFPPIPGPGDRDAYRLTGKQVEHFHEHGFVEDLAVLNGAQVGGLRERLSALGSRLKELQPRLYEVEAAWLERPDEVVLHVLGAWLVDEWFHDLVFHPAITVPLAQLLGVERLRFWHDQVFWKPGHHQGLVPWHQDYSYWTRTGPPAHITLFLCLDDMDEDNGCLRYVPGSQRWGLLPPVSFGGAMDQLHTSLSPDQRASFRDVPVRLGAGQASIHHSHTVHGSFGNRTDRPRRGIALNYMASDVRVLDGTAPLLRGTPVQREGSVVDGPHFPLVLG